MKMKAGETERERGEVNQRFRNKNNWELRLLPLYISEGLIESGIET